MRIGIVKPDWKIHGGYEVVVDRLVLGLESAGHHITRVDVDMTRNYTELPMEIPDSISQLVPDFIRYTNYFLHFSKLDVSGFDTVISTQPPSFAIKHPRHLAFFYHHQKVYYDLLDLVCEVGLFPSRLHRRASTIVRDFDQTALTPDIHIAAGSQCVKERLRRFNGLSDTVSVLYPGLDDAIYNYFGPISYNAPLLVGRHEFPKRPELFLHAMKLLPQIQGRVVGAGGQTPNVMRSDLLLSHMVQHGTAIDPAWVWKRLPFEVTTKDVGGAEEAIRNGKLRSNVQFTGRVSRNQLLREYAEALCVVCPAYEEDFGLTAVEAMCFKKPVIACVDGGGYTELIEPGVTGFLVEPTGQAIAAAVEKFVEDPERARRMGEAGYEFSRQFNWRRAIGQLNGLLADH